MTTKALSYRFCSLCGTLLHLPSHGYIATCPLCKNEQNLRAIANLEWTTLSGPADFMRRYGIEPLVPLERDVVAIAGEKSVRKERAKVKEVCPECDNDEMEYYTMQLRSADEGQTVFYECAKCKYKYSLNS